RAGHRGARSGQAAGRSPVSHRVAGGGADPVRGQPDPAFPRTARHRQGRARGCVTGPTVIAPMLRTLRPNARIANTLRWEGIVIDPLGALFAVLIYEAIVSRQEGHTIGIFLATIGCGVGIGALAAWLMAFFLRRQLIPEYLQNYAVLAAVLFAFSISNTLTHESGLLAVTIMGIALGNLRGVHIDDILDFKESLTTVLVSLLF